MNKRLVLVAVSGFLAVALGAFGAHALKGFAPPDRIGVFNLSVQYHFYHTFALAIVAFAGQRCGSRLLDWAARCFIGGTVLFCGTLYVYALTGAKWLGPITPLGGLCLLLGWLLLAAGLLRSDERRGPSEPEH
jgi:uncharacterized membrane protein YgdD (TMEM256/DUF423 family)